MGKKELRDYQSSISIKGAKILNTWGLLYLAMQVRCGKTATSLNVCKILGYKKVLFLTKKKALRSIQQDWFDFGFNNYFHIEIINNESLHKVEDNDFDCIIMDEAHRLGSFPKPPKMAVDLKKRFKHLPFIFLSGTPTPESKSQWYHQLWVSERSPFKKYNTFYSWFKACGFIKTEFDLGYGGKVANYSNNTEIIYKYFAIMKREIPKDHLRYQELIDRINETQDISISQAKEATEIMEAIISLFKISYTQEESGFTSTINENILYCEMEEKTKKMIKRLTYDRVIQGKEESIVADTAVKLQQKIHQLSSGTIRFEPRFCDRLEKIVTKSMVIDPSKAIFIKDYFKGKKIAIFYKFKEEYNALESVFGEKLTDNLDEFNTTDKNIALQIVSGREGISLKEADFLVYYNIDFSATSYWQSRDRLTTMERKTNDIYWVFTKGGIEEKIYNTVMGKKNYTLSHFKKDFNIK